MEIARRAVEAWNSVFLSETDPLPFLHDYFQNDVVLDFSRRLLDGEVYHGYDGAQSFLEQLREPWDDLQINAEEVFDAGDAVVFFTRIAGRARKAGITIDAPIAYLGVFRDGKISQLEYFGEDRAGCLEAAGLRE